MEGIVSTLLGGVIAFLIITDVVIPILIGWLVIKYVFHLRKRQNDQFLDDLGYVVHDAVHDALNDRNNASKQGTKTSWATYNATKSNDDQK